MKKIITSIAALSVCALMLTDGRMYILDHSSRSGSYMDISEEQFSEMLAFPQSVLSDINGSIDIDYDGLETRMISIDGLPYIFESSGNAGVLFYRWKCLHFYKRR